MNKKGFMSISMIFSFFIVFVSLILAIVTNLTNNKVLLNKVRENIKIDITEDNFYRYLIDNMSMTLDDDGNYWITSGSNNYVKLIDSSGNTSSLYRIIGLQNNRIKIISDTCLNNTTYAYDSSGTNVFKTSSLYTTLKTEYNNFTYKSIIDYNTYYIQGITSSDIDTTTISNTYNKEIYNVSYDADGNKIINYDADGNEIVNSTQGMIAFISLPYISDYLYTSGWLSGSFWFLTNDSSNTTNAFYLNGSSITSDSVTNKHCIKYVLYLENTVELKSGSGTSSSAFVVGGW